MNRHNAPSVVYPLGRSTFLGICLLLLWLAGLISVLLWCRAMPPTDWRSFLGGASVLGVGLAVRTAWIHLPEGQLAWDGSVWHWESMGSRTGATEHSLSVIADFQQRFLLRVENHSGASLWLWAERSALPERWLDLRRAIYSPHRPQVATLAHDFLPAEPSDDASPPAVAPSQAMPLQPVSHASP